MRRFLRSFTHLSHLPSVLWGKIPHPSQSVRSQPQGIHPPNLTVPSNPELRPATAPEGEPTQAQTSIAPENNRTAVYTTVYALKQATGRANPVLWVHNSQAKTRQQRRIRVKLQAAYHPIGRDPKKLQELGTPPGDSIWIENRYVSGHHCSIVRVGKKQRYELRDWQKGQWGTYRQNPWWKRLLTRRKFTQVQRNIVLKDGDRLVLADPKDPKKRFVRLRFVHPPVWWVRMLRWGAYGAGAGVAAATGAVGFAVYTVRDVQIEPLPSVPVPMAIYASNGQALMAGGIGTRHEDAESLAQVPELLWRSLLLSEDQQYFWHPGVNPIRVMTTAIRNR